MNRDLNEKTKEISQLVAINSNLVGSIKRLISLVERQLKINDPISKECLHLISLCDNVNNLIREIDPNYQLDQQCVDDSQKPFTVIGIDYENGDIICHHVDVKNPNDALSWLDSEHGYLEPIVVIAGTQFEGGLLTFPNKEKPSEIIDAPTRSIRNRSL